MLMIPMGMVLRQLQSSKHIMVLIYTIYINIPQAGHFQNLVRVSKFLIVLIVMEKESRYQLKEVEGTGMFVISMGKTVPST